MNRIRLRQRLPSGSWPRRPTALAVLLVVLGGAMPVAGAWGAPAAPGKQGRQAGPPATWRVGDVGVLRQRLDAAAGGWRSAPRAKTAAADTMRLVALRIEFPNLAMGASPPADELHDRFYFENQFAYVQQYFDAASTGRLHLQVDVPDRVAIAARTQESYGDFDHYDSLMVELVGEAVTQFDDVVDFGAYDGLILLHAGPGQESDLNGDSPLQIWSGYLDAGEFETELSTPDSVRTGLPTGDGVEVREAIILPEWEVQDLQRPDDARLGSLGVYVHEIGLKLGMVPLFDAGPLPIPDSQGIGNFGVMGYGLWVANGFIPTLPSAFNRMLMGWVTPRVVQNDAEVLLRDFERGAPDSVVLRVPISAREYFLVSYVLEDPSGPVFIVCNGDTFGPLRFFAFEDKNANCAFDFADTDGNGVLSPGDSIDTYRGAEWDFFMTDLLDRDTAGEGSGLLVMHVDEDVLLEVLGRGSTNVQSDPRRKAVDVEEADDIQDLDRFPDSPRSFGSKEDYFAPGQAFGPETSPSTASADGTPTGLRITLLDYPSATPATPGPVARVRIETAARSAAAAPQRRQRRTFAVEAGRDPVVLPRGDGTQAWVVPGSRGQVYAVDPQLDELPVSDGDSTTLLPWKTLPPPWDAGSVAPPAAGDVGAGAGARTDLVILAAGDSAGSARTGVFAWRADGAEIYDVDANPLTDDGLLASLAGAPRALLLADVVPDRGNEIVLAIEDSTASAIVVVDTPESGPAGTPPNILVWPLASGTRLAGGPVATGAPRDAPTTPQALAWVARQRDSGAVSLEVLEGIGGSAPVLQRQPLQRVSADSAAVWHLVSGDLDGRGASEIVVLGPDGGVDVATWTSGLPWRVRTRLEDHALSPPAVADVDGDGALEVLVTGASALHALAFSGAELPGWPVRLALDPALEPAPAAGRGAGTPLAADLDGDGALELLFPLPGGALRVHAADATRRGDLEITLPAHASGVAFADRDGDGRTRLHAAGRFERLVRWESAAGDSLVTATRLELATFEWPQIGAVAWGELGGGPARRFAAAPAGVVPTRPNAASLPSFVVGPNPARDEVRARVTVTAPAQVQCVLYNLEGERVRSAARRASPGEIVEFTFDLRAVASGIYLARMQVLPGGSRVLPVVVQR